MSNNRKPWMHAENFDGEDNPPDSPFKIVANGWRKFKFGLVVLVIAAGLIFILHLSGR